MRCLWVDDDKNIDSNYRKGYGFRDNEPVLIAQNFQDALSQIEEHYNEFDSVILDINLSNNFRFDKKMYETYLEDIIPEGKFWRRDINGKEVLNGDAKLLAGYYLYLYLLHKGFPKDRIVFLSAYAGPEILSEIDICTEEEISASLLIKKQLNDLSNITESEFHNFLNSLLSMSTGITAFDVEDQIDNLRTAFSDKENLEGQLRWCLNKIEGKNMESKSYEKTEENGNTRDLICNVEKRFSEIGIKMPQMILKNSKKRFETWKEKQDTEYYRFREGIIEACLYLKTRLEKEKDELKYEDETEPEFIIFDRFIEDNWKGQKAKARFTYDYYLEMLELVRTLLPIREPSETIKNELYKQIVKIISHDWEIAKGTNYPRNNYDKYKMNSTGRTDQNHETIFALNQYEENILNSTLGNIMKLLRNWVAHNKLDQFDAPSTAFYFIIAMRTFFKLDEQRVEPYEKILFKVINEEPCVSLKLRMPLREDPPQFKEKNKEQQEAKKEMDKCLSKSLEEIVTKCNDKSNIQVFEILNKYGRSLNKCNHLMLSRLLWHGMFYGNIKTSKYGARVEFNYRNTELLPSKEKDDFLTYIYRYTYSCFEKSLE